MEGTIDETIGTHLMFEMQDKDQPKNVPPMPITPNKITPKEGKKTLVYECSTENIITMETVTLLPKSFTTQKTTGPSDTSIIDAIC